ncbi:negative elongation factor E-like [Haliotis rufescens]|uniref:negative elongation factor E-like n=1 Tax=Haliotis rufescens TaxID=6454 RepID=UPI001EAF9942|nr:negative elongation factor E-like [Haliotis rufescens]
MVNLHFPATLTEEEEQLKLKYAKLKKKKKALQQMKTAKPEPQVVKEKEAAKRPHESAGDAMIQAKKLVQKGLIKIESDTREKTGFKRSKYLEKKLKDPEKTPSSSVSFQPFSAAAQHSEDDEKPETSTARPKVKGLYESFVSTGNRYERERERDPERERRESRDDRRDERRDREREPPKKGRTIYIHGHGISEELLRKAGSNFGNVVNITMETDRNCGFVTFEKLESADQAITEMNGSMIDNVQLKVSMARRQPTFENVTDQTGPGWSTIAASNSQKGSGHKDKRNMVVYNEDIF